MDFGCITYVYSLNIAKYGKMVSIPSRYNPLLDVILSYIKNS